MDKSRVFVYMLMRDASLKQRIPCIMRISIFEAFSAGKKCALYTGKYGNKNLEGENLVGNKNNNLEGETSEVIIIKTLRVKTSKAIKMYGATLHAKKKTQYKT